METRDGIQGQRSTADKEVTDTALEPEETSAWTSPHIE